MESELSVRDVLTKEYVGVSESDTVLDAIHLMRTERTGCVLVLRGSDPVGILTEWDALGLVADEDDPSETTADDVMSTPVLTIGADRSLTAAADTMTRENVRNLAVEEDDDLLGVVTQRDVIAAVGSFGAATPSRTDEPSLSTPARSSTQEEPLPNGGDEYTTQSVCEACGSLAESLWESNGQLLCSDCRTV
ncbi:CBS domain-containing protein [Natrialbaceae archaeon AArc-T1-2]|uniref:CBS domain-containing protein n=1 Tax=Natrialbaceae archaeon AArc-T1-2 TaxID=3053904 RepID=UPI00255A8B9E|nr:CBS domain-containing protein [Natrialbaceae archaeon AArc-T1-2]WIV67278.1 CBS domain-containing protein [Natrialbaceae archaeon AArc-T1-2]